MVHPRGIRITFPFASAANRSCGTRGVLVTSVESPAHLPIGSLPAEAISSAGFRSVHGQIGRVQETIRKRGIIRKTGYAAARRFGVWNDLVREESRYLTPATFGKTKDTRFCVSAKTTANSSSPRKRKVIPRLRREAEGALNLAAHARSVNGRRSRDTQSPNETPS
jgi:hypothetical protein